MHMARSEQLRPAAQQRRASPLLLVLKLLVLLTLADGSILGACWVAAPALGGLPVVVDVVLARGAHHMQAGGSGPAESSRRHTSAVRRICMWCIGR